MPDGPLLYFVSVAIVFAVCAWAGWEVAGRRARKPQILPDRVWLCDGLQVVQRPDPPTCYRCHRRARSMPASWCPIPSFRVDQQLGRPKGSTDLGASSPWLAGEEPLRDAWLSERARATEQALQASEPAPAFWTEPAADSGRPRRRRADVTDRGDAGRTPTPDRIAPARRRSEPGLADADGRPTRRSADPARRRPADQPGGGSSASPSTTSTFGSASRIAGVGDDLPRAAAAAEDDPGAIHHPRVDQDRQVRRAGRRP